MLSYTETISLRWFLVAVLIWIGGVFIHRPLSQAQLADRCPLGQGYWKDHAEAWPRSTLILGNPTNTAHTYTQGQLVTLLNLATQGDASIILARQLIAAKLNVFNGSNPAPIETALAQADSLFGKFPGKLPYRVSPSTPTGKSMTAVALILESYNAGELPDSCSSDNVPPVANAGDDQTAFVGDLVELDGSGSTDADADGLTYHWSFVSRPQGSEATLSDPNAVKPTFVIDSAGSYEVRLIVDDGHVNSVPDTVVISTQNSKPLANAGPDQTVFVGTSVFLDGRGSSDVDSNPLTYRWQFLGRPEGSNATLDDGTTAQPSFIADRPGSYTIELVVNDGKVDSNPDTVVISTENSKPVANAGPDQAAFVGDTVQLVGSGSTDADGDALGHFWSFTTKPQGSTASLSNPSVANPTFAADIAGLYVVQLIVSDGKLDSHPDTASITVEVRQPVNRPPVAADDSATTLINTPITITVLGNDSDPDGDQLTVTSITQPTNGKAVINLTSTVTYTPTNEFTGQDSFTYSISDGRGGKADATVRVTVNPAVGCLPPTITSIDPLSGSVGTEVTILGTNLDCGDLRNLTFNGVPAVITFLSSTMLKTFIPIGGQGGLFSYETAGGVVTAPPQFNYDVTLTTNFALLVSPSEGKVVQGTSTSYSVELRSLGSLPFTGLAELEILGLPTGLAASFSPGTLTGGQRGLLTIIAAPGVATGTVALSLRATATIDAQTVTKTTNFELTVLQGNRTVLLGQFMLKDGTPMPGVILKLISQQDGSIIAQTDTDGAGNFLFLDPPAGVLTMSVDTTPFDPTKAMPMYAIDVTVTPGQANVVGPFKVTPPPPPQAFVAINNAAQNQVVTNPDIPGVSITLPAGATVTGWDGVIKSKIAIVKLLPDELPMPHPPGFTRSLYQFNFGTSMGGVPSVPLPVTLPNDQGFNPGEKAEIWFYDAAPLVGAQGTWKKAGLGTVSADGLLVVSDPGVGIDRFCGVCGTACILGNQNNQGNNDSGSPTGGDPVNLVLGQFIEEKTDLVLPGRIPATVQRTYNPLDPFGSIAGFQLGLGAGWALSIDVVLLEVNASVRRLVLPGNARFEFAQQGTGNFVNTTDRQFAGAVLTAEPGGIHRLRFKDGRVWRFVCCWLGNFGQAQIAGLGLLVEQTDRSGNRLLIERNQQGLPIRVTEPAGRVLNFTSSDRHITQISDPIGRIVRYTYNSAGRLETVTNPAGGVTRYTYDSAGRILTITDPRNITYITNQYGTSIVDAGRVVRQTQADGGVWTFEYERFVALVSGGGGSVIGPVTGIKVKDPRGNITTHKVDSKGLTKETINALGQSTKFERNDKGQVISVTDSLNRVTFYEYDAAGNITKITDPAGNIRLFEYDPTFNKVTKITDPLANVTTFEYDARGNLIAITDPEQNLKLPSQRLKALIAYDSFGQRTSISDPLRNVTKLTYDNFGNLSTIVDPLGNKTQRTQDLVSRLIKQTDPRGNVTRYSYDALDRLSQITDAIRGVTHFTYDANSNLLTATDAHGKIKSHTYDNMDRLSTRTDQLGQSDHYNYDFNGNLTSVTDRKGQLFTYQYDALDRRVGTLYGDKSSIRYQFDSIGQLLRATDSVNGELLFSYDSVGRQISSSAELGSIHYGYDNVGRRTSMTVSGEPTVNYTYDANSRLRQVVKGTQVVTFDYDAANRRTKVTLPNGASSNYSYDPAGRLTELLYTKAAGTVGNLTYQYDATGNRNAIGGSFARTVLPESINSASYDNANRQVSFGSKQNLFDLNGNMVSTRELSNTTFTWDSRNRLASLSGINNSGTFAYDALGRRVAKTINNITTKFLYDGPDVIREFTGTKIVSYLRSLNVDEPLVRDNNEFYFADHLGSVIAITDATGNIQTEYSYSPFGITTLSGAQSLNPFQFTGRENDGTGLMFYRARYLSPFAMRFISEDPLKSRRPLFTLYTYVQNNPLSFRDPTGLDKDLTFKKLLIEFEGLDDQIKAYEEALDNQKIAQRWIYMHIMADAALEALAHDRVTDEESERLFDRSWIYEVMRDHQAEMRATEARLGNLREQRNRVFNQLFPPASMPFTGPSVDLNQIRLNRGPTIRMP